MIEIVAMIWHGVDPGPSVPGFVPATPHHPSLPTGRAEIPHLIFLLTLVPILFATFIAMYILIAPYCIMYFAFTVQTSGRQILGDSSIYIIGCYLCFITTFRVISGW